MTEQTLWTSGTAIVVAFFTTVIAQYVFAPTLEARKQRILERSKVSSEIADELRAMNSCLLEERHQRHIRIADLFSEPKHAPSFHQMVTSFDVKATLNHAGLRTDYETLIIQTISAADIFCYEVPIRSDEFEPIEKLFQHTINALDPVNPPWVRASHCRRGTKLNSTLEVPNRRELDDAR